MADGDGAAVSAAPVQIFSCQCECELIEACLANLRHALAGFATLKLGSHIP